MGKSIIYILVFLFVSGLKLVAQDNPQKLADEYKKKIEAAKTVEEKQRLAKELQDKLLPNDFQQQYNPQKQADQQKIRKEYMQRIQAAKTPEEKWRLSQEMNEKLAAYQSTPTPIDFQKITTANNQRYKVTFSFSAKEDAQQSCGKECGNPCTFSNSFNSMTTLSGSLQGDMTNNYGLYTMALTHDKMYNLSAGGSNNSTSIDKGCKETRTCITNGRLYMEGREKERTFSFTYNKNTNYWDYSINIPSIDHTSCKGNDEGETDDGQSILFFANSSNNDITLHEENGKITLQGSWTVSDNDQQRGKKGSSTFNISIIIAPLTIGKYEAITCRR
ncbi:MAG: hypothetical protein HYZ42_02370 [Bacteroidetes bacterium]|nr:hypothetical protein [Bacteroidota bacterium]